MRPSARADGGLADALQARLDGGERYFAAEAGRLASLCHRMAERFARSGRLIAIADTPSARSDARHVAVEFVHPVIVGKRALPALALLDGTADLLAGPEDIVIAFGGEEVADAVAAARRRGALTIAFAPLGAQWEFPPAVEDPLIAQELVETFYHVVWELVHVFFEHRGLLGGRAAGPVHDVGASSFLYPFLSEREDNLDAVLDDVRRSALAKSAEVGELRRQTLREGEEALRAAAATLRERFAAAGKVLALGNGGSSTDAMDLVADLRHPAAHRTARAALDLSEDPAIITAVANDVGVEAIFARQVIAYGTEHDALIAISTSGNSVNVVSALREARRRGLASIAFVGYDGGRVATEGLADHVIITRSQHIPRIQEAQASAYHMLCELVG